MLLLFSFFALIEGIIRMTTYSKPSADVDYFDNAGGTAVPVVVFLTAGVAETLFGIAGIYVAVYQLLFRMGHPTVTLGFAIGQGILGWFVFIVFVLVGPIVAASNTNGIDGLLTPREHAALLIFGNLLASFSFCWALQGGQFIMALRLWQSQMGMVVLRRKNALRAVVWSGNVIAAAISTLYVGALLSSKGFSSTTGPVGAPPHVVWVPGLSIICGLIMLAYGVLGLLTAYPSPTNTTLATTYMPLAWGITTTAMMINFSWVFGIVPGLAPPIPGAAQHAGLILAVTLLPVFHVWQAHYPSDTEMGEETAKGTSTTAPAAAATATAAPAAGATTEIPPTGPPAAVSAVALQDHLKMTEDMA